MAARPKNGILGIELTTDGGCRVVMQFDGGPEISAKLSAEERLELIKELSGKES